MALQRDSSLRGRTRGADPLLIAPAPDAPPAAFGLQPGSPARGAAIDGPLVSGLDLFGTQRSSAGKFDCGAIEAASAPAEHKRSR